MQTSTLNSYTIKSLPDQIFHSIKKLILSGQLKCGERILETKVAQEFGVSRTPIREALRKLEEYGLVSIKPRKYAEVLVMSHEEVVELTLVRVHLERLAVRLFIERQCNRNMSALQDLAQACKELSAKGAFGDFYEKDSELHLEIARQTGNIYLYDSMFKLDAKVQLSRLVKPLNAQDVRNAILEHETILSALAIGSITDAENSMENHIRSNL